MYAIRSYYEDVRARIGGLKSGGLSYTPDAVLLSGRMLMKNPADLKHLFVFTDDVITSYSIHYTKLYEFDFLFSIYIYYFRFLLFRLLIFYYDYH